MAVKESVAQEGARDTARDTVRKGCARCGATGKALLAPVSNARNYRGAMYCVRCNPRFSGGGMDAVANLERMGA